MKIFFGLGNPGDSYHNTRHNIGWKVIDAIAKVFLGIAKFERFKQYTILYTSINGIPVALVKSKAGMNLSGQGLASLLTHLGASPEDVHVIHDDIDMSSGKLRLRLKGSARGHNGVRSIIEAIGENFCRLKIGIGRGQDVSSHVLGEFSDRERDSLRSTFNCVASIVSQLTIASNITGPLDVAKIQFYAPSSLN